MVAGTFNGFSAVDGSKLQPNAFAELHNNFNVVYRCSDCFWFLLKKRHVSGKVQAMLGIDLIVLMLIGRIVFQFISVKQLGYMSSLSIFSFASVTPMWLLKQPRDYLTTFLFVGMIVAAVVGVLFYNPTISLPAFTGFTSETGGYMFPTLFITMCLLELFLVLTFTGFNKNK